jgi:hypothetical protein
MLLEHTSSITPPDTLCSLIAGIKDMYKNVEHGYMCHAIVEVWVVFTS